MADVATCHPKHHLTTPYHPPLTTSDGADNNNVLSRLCNSKMVRVCARSCIYYRLDVFFFFLLSPLNGRFAPDSACDLVREINKLAPKYYGIMAPNSTQTNNFQMLFVNCNRNAVVFYNYHHRIRAKMYTFGKCKGSFSTLTIHRRDET